MSDDHRHLIRHTRPQPPEHAQEGQNDPARKLGAATGMQRLAIIEGYTVPGAATTLTVGPSDEAFLQIRAGEGELKCDGQCLTLIAGDLLSIRTPDTLPALNNRGFTDLIWLLGVHSAEALR